MFSYIYRYFLRNPLGGGKMLLDSPSREFSFETNLSAANSITKRSIYRMNVSCHIPGALDHFVRVAFKDDLIRKKE